MNIYNAAKRLGDKQGIRRKDWAKTEYVFFSSDLRLHVNNLGEEEHEGRPFYKLGNADMLATDWEVISTKP